MSEELTPTKTTEDSGASYPLPLPLLPVLPEAIREHPPLAPPPMEPGKNVRLAMYRDPAGREALFYKSTVATNGGNVMARSEESESRGRRRGFLSVPLVLLLIVLAANGIMLWSAKNARTIKCDLCGARVKEWTDVYLTQRFSSIPYMIENAMLGNTVPEDHYEICQGCYARFRKIMQLTQSKDFEALFNNSGG